jgi:predicted RNA-binding Zn-ribbon protein involved in translation (DUF1610 family)
MEMNSKRLESTSRLIYYGISVILCAFLILLSNNIINDLDRVVRQPTVDGFEDKAAMSRVQHSLDSSKSLLENLNAKKGSIEKTITAARENYQNEKQSFDNWIQTRKTLGSPDKDQEVTDRARKLDEYYKVEQDWRSQLGSVQNEIDAREKAIDQKETAIAHERNLAEDRFEKEQRVYELRVFLFRLLFVGPVLALGIFFFIRYRKSKFWPLYLGFSLFSLYAFFFGLLPYLPSYGGYVRNTVGIMMSVGLGYYAIKRIRQYIEEKKQELKTSTEVRATRIQQETAEKALENHFCPSCGKDFIIKKWEMPMPASGEPGKDVYVTKFCRHCGLELFKNCTSCSTRNFAHLPFCSSCGTKLGGGS